MEEKKKAIKSRVITTRGSSRVETTIQCINAYLKRFLNNPAIIITAISTIVFYRVIFFFFFSTLSSLSSENHFFYLFIQLQFNIIVVSIFSEKTETRIKHSSFINHA